jgi:RHS repeat-associated protein
MPQTKNVVQMKYTYDRGSRRRWRETANAPSGTKEAEGYLYDGLSQVTNRKRGTLERDTLGAITGMAFPPEREELLSFDTLGNWQRYTVKEAEANASPPAQSTLFDHTRNHNVANQLTTFSNSTQPVLHDAAGNPTRQSPAPSGNWNQLTEYVWDAWNRLISVKVAGTEIARHAYDGLFRRTWLQEGGTSAAKRHFYYNDQWRSIEERLDNGEPERHHVFHPHNRWHLLLRDRDTNSDGTLNERLYSLHDAMDPVAICDAGGTVQERFNYSAFGQRRVMDVGFTDKTNGTEKAWNWEFHGEFSDGASGLHNYGYRYYSPVLGRWLGRDPIGEIHGHNLQVAYANNAINGIDVIGLETMLIPRGGMVPIIVHRITPELLAIAPGPFFNPEHVVKATGPIVKFDQRVQLGSIPGVVCHTTGSNKWNQPVHQHPTGDHWPPTGILHLLPPGAPPQILLPQVSGASHKSGNAAKKYAHKLITENGLNVEVIHPANQQAAKGANSASGAAALMELGNSFMIDARRRRFYEEAINKCKQDAAEKKIEGCYCCNIFIGGYVGANHPAIVVSSGVAEAGQCDSDGPYQPQAPSLLPVYGAQKGWFDRFVHGPQGYIPEQIYEFYKVTMR